MKDRVVEENRDVPGPWVISIRSISRGPRSGFREFSEAVDGVERERRERKGGMGLGRRRMGFERWYS